MGTYDKFKTDPRLEQEGIALNLGEAGTFFIARAGGGNKAFALKFQAATRPHRRAIQAGAMDESTATNILRDVYAEHVVKNWEGVTDANGQPLPYNKANASALLKDLPWLFEEIRRVAEDASNFRAFEMETDAGNSERS